MQSIKEDSNEKEHFELAQPEFEKEKEKESERRWEILKETFVEFSQRTDINAYGKIFVYENNFVKLVWLVIFFGSLSLTAWVMSWSVSAYLQYGVVSQIGVVFETPTEFPAVTFCDSNPFTRTVKLPVWKNNMLSSRDNNLISGRMYASDPSYGDKNRQKLGLNKSQLTTGTYAYCLYNNIDCKKDLHWYWDYDYGNCFQFNVGLNSSNQPIALKQSSSQDPELGLRIGLFPLVNENVYTSDLPGGIVVFVHNASMRPLKSDGIFIKMGEKSLISVKRTFIDNVNSPYTDCQDLTSYSSTLYDFIKNSKQYSTYRQKDCLNLCIQESIISQCNCFYSGFDNPYSNLTVKPCLSFKDYTCFTNVFNKFVPNECASNSCPLECEYIEYDLTISSLISPTYLDYQINTINDKSQGFCNANLFGYLCNGGLIDYETFKSYFSSFTVFYSSSSYTLLETTPAMTLVNLMANLSGTMGIVVSVSLFTLFEIAEFILLMLHALIFKKTI